MLRLLSNVCSTLSLLVCLSLACVWVRSYWIADVFIAMASTASVQDRGVFAVTSLGKGRVSWYPGLNTEGRPSPMFFEHMREVPRKGDLMEFVGMWTDLHCEKQWAWLGLGYWRSTGGIEKTMMFPLWLPCLFTLFLPARRMLRYVHQRRRRVNGLCLVCGYDLRASVERCPECGSGIAAVRAIHSRG